MSEENSGGIELGLSRNILLSPDFFTSRGDAGQKS